MWAMDQAPEGMDETVGRQALEILARVAGLRVPAEDMDELALALLRECETLHALREIPASDEPIYGFDPRWK